MCRVTIKAPAAAWLVTKILFWLVDLRAKIGCFACLLPELVLKCDLPDGEIFVGLTEMPVGETILSCLTGSVGNQKKNWKR